MRKQFRFWVNDEKLTAFLDSKTKEYGEFSNFARETFDLIMKNKLDPRTIEQLKKEKLQVDIEWKKVETEYRKLKIKYEFTFNALPTKSGSKALRDKATNEVQSYNPPEEMLLKEFIEKNWNKYVETLRHREDGWIIECKLCNTGFPCHDSKEGAIDRLKIHLGETHLDELFKKVEY